MEEFVKYKLAEINEISKELVQISIETDTYILEVEKSLKDVKIQAMGDFIDEPIKLKICGIRRSLQYLGNGKLYLASQVTHRVCEETEIKVKPLLECDLEHQAMAIPHIPALLDKIYEESKKELEKIIKVGDKI